MASDRKEILRRWRLKVVERKCVECSASVFIANYLLPICDSCKPVRMRRFRPQTFKVCGACKEEFGPVETLSRQFCSKRCVYDGIMARPKKPRWVRTKAAAYASSAVAYAILRGDLKRPQKCENCGGCGKSGKIEAAHVDYSKPLEVRWLCRSCHVRFDKKDPKGGAFRESELRERLSG